MAELWAVVGALATVVLPLVLAGWLLGRSSRRPPKVPRPRGKMPADEKR